jgi:hypothetical protein
MQCSGIDAEKVVSLPRKWIGKQIQTTAGDFLTSWRVLRGNTCFYIRGVISRFLSWVVLCKDWMGVYVVWRAYQGSKLSAAIADESILALDGGNNGGHFIENHVEWVHCCGDRIFYANPSAHTRVFNLVDSSPSAFFFCLAVVFSDVCLDKADPKFLSTILPAREMRIL